MDIQSFEEYYAPYLTNKELKYVSRNHRLPKKLKPSSLMKITRALDRSWELYREERRLFWTRASFGWVLNGLLFTVVGAAWQAELNLSVGFLLSFTFTALGITLTAAQQRLHEGSLEWQRNWQYHVALLEDAVEGPLFKRISKQKWPSTTGPHRIVLEFIHRLWWVAFLFVIAKSALQFVEDIVELGGNMLSLGAWFEGAIEGAFWATNVIAGLAVIVAIVQGFWRVIRGTSSAPKSLLPVKPISFFQRGFRF